jgi:ABC-2 type transport system permease protein
MNIRSITAIARKDALDILLNKSTLIGLCTPIVLAIFFMIITSLLGGRTSQVLIYNPGHSQIEQSISGIFASPQIVRAGSADEVVAAFGTDGSHRDTSYALGLVVPENFEAQLRQGGRPDIKLYLNGNELNNRDRETLTQLVNAYASSVTHPHPVNLSLAMINPPQTTPVADIANGYLAIALLMSFLTGTSLVPSLLVEEKEKKTLRMLMVSPASYGDVIMGKLLVGLGYQLVLTLIVLLVMHGFTGNLVALFCFIVLDACFSLTLGLLIGSLIQTQNALGAILGALSLIYIFPAIFAGTLASLFQGSLVMQIIQIFPTYYMADGLVKALNNQSLQGGMLLDFSVVLACTVVAFLAAVWSLRRQAAVVATI